MYGLGLFKMDNMGLIRKSDIKDVKGLRLFEKFVTRVVNFFFFNL